MNFQKEAIGTKAVSKSDEEQNGSHTKLYVKYDSYRNCNTSTPQKIATHTGAVHQC